jgi:hypothetical protein
MKKRSWILLSGYLCYCILPSCDTIYESDNSFSAFQSLLLRDSSGLWHVEAAFNEDGAYSLIVHDSAENMIARKLTYRHGFPVFVDSLTKSGPGSYSSEKYNTTYTVNDTSVISVRIAKIIHPSSNWQGQTSWQRPIVNTYKRLDGVPRFSDTPSLRWLQTLNVEEE